MLKEWLDLLKAIPGAAKALTEVVGEVGHAGAALVRIGTAKAEQKVQAIKSDTQMATEASEALTRVAIQHIEQNADSLGPRALAYGARRFVKQQQNREAVTFEALENLRLNPPDEPPSAMPTDDWLNVFGKLAENASSEKLRAHFAHVMESEIRKPGSISLVTLQMVSLLDEQLAQCIERIRPYIIDGANIPLIGKMTQGDYYMDLVSLAGIGFVHIADHSFTTEDDADPGGQPIEFVFERCRIVVPPVQIAPDVLRTPVVTVPSVIVSQAGRELLTSLAPTPLAHDLPAMLHLWLRGQGFQNARMQLDRSGV